MSQLSDLTTCCDAFPATMEYPSNCKLKKCFPQQQQQTTTKITIFKKVKCYKDVNCCLSPAMSCWLTFSDWSYSHLGGHLHLLKLRNISDHKFYSHSNPTLTRFFLKFLHRDTSWFITWKCIYTKILLYDLKTLFLACFVFCHYCIGHRLKYMVQLLRRS